MTGGFFGGMSWKSSGGNISRGVWMLRFRGANWAFMMHHDASLSIRIHWFKGIRYLQIYPKTIQNLWLEWPVEQKHLVHWFNGYQWHNSVCSLLSHTFPRFHLDHHSSPKQRLGANEDSLRRNWRHPAAILRLWLSTVTDIYPLVN